MSVKWDTLLSSKKAAEQFINNVFAHYETEIKQLPKFQNITSNSSLNKKIQALGILFTSVKLAKERARIREDASKWAQKKKQEGATQSKEFLINDYIKGKEGQTGTSFNYKPDKVFKRENNRLARINCAFGIACRGASPENSLPSDANGLGGEGGWNEEETNNNTWDRNNKGSVADKCRVCQGDKKVQREWFVTGDKKEYCGKCYRQHFIDSVLKKLSGWNQLDPAIQEHYLLQIDKCKRRTDFRTLKQMVIDAIQEISYTCSQCGKTSVGKRLGIEGIEDKIFCSKKCLLDWCKENRRDSGQEGINTQTSEGENEGSEAEDADSGYNSGSNSDNENEEGNFDFSLFQIQENAEQEIKKALEESDVSEQELNEKIRQLRGRDWKDCLNNLDSSEKITAFVEEIKQIILQSKLDKMTSSKGKNPKNDLIFPAAISIVSFLALTSLILIVRRKRRRRF